MNWIIFLAVLFFTCTMLFCIIIAIDTAYHTICAQHLLSDDYADGALSATATWKQCSQCQHYERSSKTTCARHPETGILVTIDLPRSIRLHHVLNNYYALYPNGDITTSYHRDVIGAYYLWLQDVSQRQDWDEAVWIAVEQHMDTREQVEAFLTFLEAYETHMEMHVTLHGALKAYCFRQTSLMP